MLFNRDLSWLSFNYRVLQEAKDNNVPLYERLRFLAIFSSNLDEFFRVRYPVIATFDKINARSKSDEVIFADEHLTEKTQNLIAGQLDEYGSILNNELIPQLKEKNIFFYYNNTIQPAHLAEIKQIFLSEVLSFIQPVFLSKNNKVDFLPENGRLYFIVTLTDTTKETISHVCVNIPSHKLKRFFVLTPIDGVDYVIFIDDIIRENIGMLFPGIEIKGIYSIKFNRNAEINLKDELSSDLLDKIEKQLSKRDNGNTSRFLFERSMPVNLQLFLASVFNVRMKDMFEGGRYHNLSDMFNFPVFDKSLFYSKQQPLQHPPINDGDIFANITEQDVLLHLPYQSYTPVLRFFNQAAVDADVTEIYITLYRVATESHIVNALISAAKNGKKVTAFIELKARFDEANNIKWSRVMKKAGVKLIYSDPSIKVHSKIGLVKKVRNEEEQCFAVISTGNFNETTASFYTDHVLMTCKEEVCEELKKLFDHLQKRKHEEVKKHLQFNELFVSQFNLVKDFEKLIAQEIKKAKNGLPALIRIKVNNLEEPYFINLLYEASKKGVKINLIVRSICCLIPEKEGLSENITIKRIVDKYLEHTRLFIFGADEDAVIAMGSSDLMTRNLRRRIEVCINVKNEYCKKQLLDYFDIQWNDTSKAVKFTNEMHQVRLQSDSQNINAQANIYDYLKEASC